MRITFRSCGYQAAFLTVTCANSQTGSSNQQLLYVTDTAPSSCVVRLATACNAVGYRTESQGDSLRIFGTGIRVSATGPVFTAQDF